MDFEWVIRGLGPVQVTLGDCQASENTKHSNK